MTVRRRVIGNRSKWKAEVETVGAGRISMMCPVFYKIWTYYLVMSSFYAKFATCSNSFTKWTYHAKIRQK